MTLCLNALITRQLGRLSLGIARTGARFNHSGRKESERIEPQFQPGHGEKIWIFHHILDGMTVYSHSPVLKANRALKQIPFNGKKLKPSKIRRDYWRPLAMVQLPDGYGEVGRTVYHRMRECMMLRALAWRDEDLYDKETNKPLTKHERGRRLNDQKANTIADLAVVLGGVGKGNKIRPQEVLAEDAAADALDAQAGRQANAARSSDLVDGLLKVTVFWANALDRKFAEEWPANVTHATFEDAGLVPKEGVEEEVTGDGEESQKAPAAIPAELAA